MHEGRRAPLCVALAPGFHISRLRRLVPTFEAKPPRHEVTNEHLLVLVPLCLGVFGGVGSEKATNEVWVSSDGVAWKQEERAPWFPRAAHYTTVFKGRLWIYGGKTGTTYEQADDVWFMSRA